MLVKISSNDLAYVVHNGHYVAAITLLDRGDWIVCDLNRSDTGFHSSRYCTPEDADEMIIRALSAK